MEKKKIIIIGDIDSNKELLQQIVNSKITNGFDVQVTYEKPANLEPLDPVYDLLIISPEIFVSTLQPLIRPKEKYGVMTTIKTTEDIFNEYTGRDKRS